MVGLSGYTYKNRRKGNDLVGGLVKSAVGQRVEWTASGREVVAVFVPDNRGAEPTKPAIAPSVWS